MKALRRSIKSEKTESRIHQHHNSLSHKDPVAILPPKKVIRALHDYEANPEHPEELSFTRGDFFHVISRENDTDWYEACNPSMPNARGMVPVSYFQVLGRNERDSGGSITSSPGNRIPDNDSGYSDRSGGPGFTNTPDPNGRPVRFSKSVGKGSGAMVYGVIMYDFKAERADELDAKEGEAIIVIAQSNPEWFVAKPIGRLGGPGLIPVSFIEIRDMSTGQAVPDAQEAVQRAGVPKVEEWKKMAADYKNSSISLGKFETTSAQQPIQGGDIDPNQGYHDGGQGYGNGQANGDYSRGGHQSSHLQAAYPDHNPHSRPHSQQMLYPIEASIPRWFFANDKYWYVIEATMADKSVWQLSRLYSDFYDFQIALLTKFPEEAGKTGEPRSLPFMPGPVTYVTDVISNGRQQNLDEYISKMLRMPEKISRCDLVCNLFAPRSGDVEMYRDASNPHLHAHSHDYPNRLSDASQQSSNDSPEDASQQSLRGHGSHHHLNGNGHHGGPPGLSAPPPRQQQQQQKLHHHSGSFSNKTNQYHHSTSSLHPPPELDRQASSLTEHSNSSHPSANSQSTSGALKIKVYYADELIAIRVPQNISFDALRDKLRERLAMRDGDGVRVQYRDGASGSYVDMASDADLDAAINAGGGVGGKVILYVNY